MNIIIADTAIRHIGNLYNLNDLHKASGGEDKHKPANWLRTQQAVDLIAELQASHIRAAEENQDVIEVKNGVGTFVCKELVYAYAMWISAAFNLKVIRTFDRVSSQPVPDPAALLNDPAALRGLLIGYTEKVEALENKIELDAPKVAFAERHAKAEGWFCIRDAAKQIGIPERQFINHLLTDGYVYRAQGSGRLMPYADTIKRGLMDVRTHTVMREDGTEKATQQAMVMTKGIQFFQHKYRAEVAA